MARVVARVGTRAGTRVRIRVRTRTSSTSKSAALWYSTTQLAPVDYGLRGRSKGIYVCRHMRRGMGRGMGNFGFPKDFVFLESQKSTGVAFSNPQISGEPEVQSTWRFRKR